MEPHYQNLYEALANVQGYIFPNEIDLQWGILIVVYPFITGLVAGAFILASLERVFKVKILKSTYQIALLTALSFLLVATLPLDKSSVTATESLRNYDYSSFIIGNGNFWLCLPVVSDGSAFA